jgi:hypothetical protein
MKEKFLSFKGKEQFFSRPVTGYCRLGCVFSFLRKSVASIWRQVWSIWTTVSLWLGDKHYSSLKCDVAIFILTDRTVRRSSIDICVRVCIFSFCHFLKILCYESSTRESRARQSLCLIKYIDMKSQGSVGKLHYFLTSALEGGGRWTSTVGPLTPSVSGGGAGHHNGWMLYRHVFYHIH